MNSHLFFLPALSRLASSLHSRTSHRPSRNPSRPLQPRILLLLATIEVLGKEIHIDTLIKKEEEEDEKIRDSLLKACPPSPRRTNIDKMIIGGRVDKEKNVPGHVRLIDLRMVMVIG